MAMDPRVAEVIAAKARQYGQDPAYMLRQAQIESGGNPNAQNPRSSAGGLFQFIDSTAAQYGLRDKFDAEAASDAAARLARDNGAYLTPRLGRDPTPGELYLAHQQGAGGAAKLLSNPDAPAASLVGAKAVTGNGGSTDETAAQFAARWTGKFDGSGPAVTMPGAPVSTGAFGLAGPTASGTLDSVTPAAGATMQAPVKDDGPDIVALLKTLTGGTSTTSPVAQAAAAPAAPAMLAPHRPQVPAFDASRFFAMLPSARAR